MQIEPADARLVVSGEGASVAGEAVEQSARASRLLLHSTPEAARLAGRVGMKLGRPIRLASHHAFRR